MGLSVISNAKPRSHATLLPGEVRVWQADLDACDVTELRPLLSADETARAARYHAEQHRVRFTVARGILRRILSHYLPVAPQEIVFDYGQHGKPYLADHPLYFNVSHSGPMLLIALSRHEVGVDIERLREPREMIHIAESYFSVTEAERMKAITNSARAAYFFELWTKKEALCKAHGTGLAYGLESNDQTDKDWSLRTLAAPTGYAAALAMPDADWTVHRHDWNSRDL